MDKTLWIPLAVLFITALVTALVKRYSRDSCLKVFDDCFVFIRMKTGKWIWGTLQVYSNALELQYTSKAPFRDHFKKSYILYEQNLENIDRILRPSPAEGTIEQKQWCREIRKLQNPSFYRRAKRKLRNLINLLRDAFAQAFIMIFGALKKGRTLSKVNIGDDRVGEVGRSLVNVVPNAYEPILEKYLGHSVVVETISADKVTEQLGVLQEYSARYVLIRGAEALPELPPGISDFSKMDRDTFDVIFPRQTNSVRHRAEPLERDDGPPEKNSTLA